MLNLLGEYNCKVDAKGRLMFPSKLKKQLEKVIHDGLVVNRDIFEKCLILYPKPEWEKVHSEMSRLSRYSKKHQLFQRKFMKGATLVELDSSGRILIPSMLLEYCGVEIKKSNEVVISGIGQKMELWNKSAYENEVVEDDFDIAALAEEMRKDIEGFNDENK